MLRYNIVALAIFNQEAKKREKKNRIIKVIKIEYLVFCQAFHIPVRVQINVLK